MSINKLNLQIGGGKTPEELFEEQTLREAGLTELIVDEASTQLADLYEDYQVPDERTELREDFIGEPTSPINSHIAALADGMSTVHKRTHPQGKPEFKSDIALRIEGLENQFNMMKSTMVEGLGGMGGRNLVSGIGQGGDGQTPGGGAVWLWDLDDVNIGTPEGSDYPVIADNAIIKFDSATEKWIIGSDSHAGDALPLSGGTMTGDIVFAPTQTFPGTLELTGGTMLGDITFAAGQPFGTLGGDISIDSTYSGDITAGTSIQTKDSVLALIASGFSAGGNFTFKGTTDVTSSSVPSNPDSGDFYINTVAGTAAVEWTGIANSSISADQLIIWSTPAARWFAGAVEDNTTYLPKTGGTMSGDIVFAGTQTFPASITQPYLQLAGGTMTGTLYMKNAEIHTGQTLTIKRGNNNTSIGGLDIKGYAPNDLTNLTDIFNVGYGNQSSTADYINYKGKTDGLYNIQNLSSVQALIAAIPGGESDNILDGGTILKSGGTADNSGNLYIKQDPAGTSGNLYIKDKDGNTNISLYPGGNVNIGNKIIMGGTSTTNNIKHLQFIGNTATSANFSFGADINSLTQSFVVNAAGVDVAGTATVSGDATVSGVLTQEDSILLRSSGNVTDISMSDTEDTGRINFWMSPDFSSSSNNIVEIKGGGTGQVQAGIGLRRGNIYFNSSQDQAIAFGGTGSKLLNFISYSGNDTTASSTVMSIGSSTVIAEGSFDAKGGLRLAGDYNDPQIMAIGSQKGMQITDGNTPTVSSQNQLVLINSGYVQSDVRVVLTGENSVSSDDPLQQPGTILFNSESDNAYITKTATGSTVSNFVRIGGGKATGVGNAAAEFILTVGKNASDKRVCQSVMSADTNKDFVGNYTIWNKYIAASFGAVTAVSSSFNGPSGEDGEATSYNMGAQFTLSRPVASDAAGQGLTLTGTATSNLTNTSAILLRLNHNISGTADDIEYFGDTAGTHDLQTKTSCDATYGKLVGGNSFSGENDFHNPEGNGHAAITVRDADGTGYPFGVFGNGDIQSDGKMIIGKLGSGIKIANCDSQSGSPGCLSFHMAGSNPGNGASRIAHILFSPSGNPDGSMPGNWIFARDTVTSNVAATDKFFTLVAPYGNAAGVKTVFNQPIEVSTTYPASTSGVGVDTWTTYDSVNRYGTFDFIGHANKSVDFQFGETENALYTSLSIGYQAPVSAQYGFDASSHKIINVASPATTSDAATKGYVDTLKTTIYNAVNGSSDYATLKSALLAALS